MSDVENYHCPSCGHFIRQPSPESIAEHYKLLELETRWFCYFARRMGSACCPHDLVGEAHKVSGDYWHLTNSDVHDLIGKMKPKISDRFRIGFDEIQQGFVMMEFT